MRKNVLLLLICILLNACNKETKKVKFTYNATINSIDKNPNFDDIVKDFRYIKLETNDRCLIGDIRKMIFYNDRIYLLSDGVFCFDINGKFIFAIDNKGQGPTDFIRIDEMTLSNNKIYLYDNSRWRVMVFDYYSGSYQNSIDIPYSVPQVLVVKNSFIIDRNHFPNNYVKGNDRVFSTELNSPDKIVNSYFPEKRFEIYSTNQLNEQNGEVFFSDPFYNKVFSVKQDGIENLFSLNFNDNLTEKEIETLLEEGRITSQAIRDKGKGHYLRSFVEAKSFITAQFNFGNKIATLLYDKTSNKCITYEDVLCKSYQLPPVEINAVYGEYLCKAVPSFVLYTNNQSEKKEVELSSNHPDYLNQIIYKGVKIEDNPVIVMYRFKPI